MQVKKLIFLALIAFNTFAWQKEYKSYLKKCDTKSFKAFYKKFSHIPFNNRDRNELENHLTHLYFSSHMSTHDQYYLDFAPCGSHFSLFYLQLTTQGKAQDLILNEWLKCFENKYKNKTMPQVIKENLKCAKKSF